ncbi:Hypothetical_protein [Hexamita inflata]|uniref:Hypothetical_protein n=1 Tax=Hexamita inflata TaxID=28002 RepID=A0AA86UIY1_9EUKA|nr:Hypothetical protein HINF_LOCUS45209 [Hexamita inflata]
MLSLSTSLFCQKRRRISGEQAEAAFNDDWLYDHSRLTHPLVQIIASQPIQGTQSSLTVMSTSQEYWKRLSISSSLSSIQCLQINIRDLYLGEQGLEQQNIFDVSSIYSPWLKKLDNQIRRRGVLKDN